MIRIKLPRRPLGRGREAAAESPSAPGNRPTSHNETCQTREIDLARLTEIARASIALSEVAPELSSLATEMAAGARQQAATARQIADEAAAMTRELESAFASLRQSSASIGGIVDLIRRLADQSKILAVNAAIEATHAGTAGLAFGVVATEVERLARQTSGATADVGVKVSVIEASIARAIATAGLDVDSTSAEAKRGSLSVRGVGDRMLNIAEVAEQHSGASAHVAETGRTVRSLCDQLLVSIGGFRFQAHARAARMFRQIAELPALREGDPARVESALAAAMSSGSSAFELLYFVDSAGIQRTRNIWRDARKCGADAIGRDWSKREWFLHAMEAAEDDLAISGIYRSEATDRYCFSISRRIRDAAANCVGVLAGDVDFAALLDS